MAGALDSPADLPWVSTLTTAMSWLRSTPLTFASPMTVLRLPSIESFPSPAERSTGAFGPAARYRLPGGRGRAVSLPAASPSVAPRDDALPPAPPGGLGDAEASESSPEASSSTPLAWPSRERMSASASARLESDSTAELSTVTSASSSHASSAPAPIPTRPDSVSQITPSLSAAQAPSKSFLTKRFPWVK